MVLITHRIFAHFNFDKIIVLDHGKIVEHGTHQELLARKGLYFKLFELQQEEEKNKVWGGCTREKKIMFARDEKYIYN